MKLILASASPRRQELLKLFGVPFVVRVADIDENWNDLDSYSRRAWLEAGTDGGTIKRTTVCTMEIWVEAFGGNPDRIDRYAAKEIRDIMAGLPEWRHQGNDRPNFKPYGRQRYYKRIDSTEE